MSLVTNTARIEANMAGGAPWPPGGSTSAGHIVASLSDVYDRLAGHPSLRPGPVVDALFGRLVRTILDTRDEQAAQVLDDPRVRALMPDLRDLCARGEGALEFEWAARICAADNPSDELARFPYLQNYRLLSRMETGVLASAVAGPVRSPAFVGCGPLPLSACHFAKDFDVAVDSYDRDPAAIATARRVAGRLGLDHLRFHLGDAADVDLSRHDVVVLAALVGATPEEKRHVVAHIRDSMARGAILLVRSARGMRTLLYPPIDVAALVGYELINAVHPVNEIVNSAIVARVSGRRAPWRHC